MGVCFNCKKSLNIIGDIGRREECSSCRADVHVCKNCHFYDRNAYNECHETQADVVKEKDRANFCEYFQISKKEEDSNTLKLDLKAKAEALFKKK